VPEAAARRSPRHQTHPTSPRICHPPFAICHPPFAICHPPSAICHLPFATRILSFPIPRSEFRIPHYSEGFERPQQLSVPGGLVPAVALECRAAIERRAVAPLGGLVCLDFLVLGQQFLEPADVLIEDRADEGQRRGLIGGPGANLAIGHRKQLVSVLFSTKPDLTPIIYNETRSDTNYLSPFYVFQDGKKIEEYWTI